jgi:arylsulfatase A-like enzyme
MLAVPATLSGIGPYQDSALLYTQPLIWDYAKQFDYKRFFLSSHTLEWYRFADFYKHDSLDVWWNHDNSGLPYYNDLGIRDELTINKAIKTINSFKDNPFTGVIQLNTTHYPYRVPADYAHWNGHYQDAYNNAVRYQDAILGKLFDYLQRTNKLKNTVILLTSDHGESLMEHHNIGHVESNYYETIAIPLFAYIPPTLLTQTQRIALSKNQKNITSNIDLVPTLLDLWNLDQQSEWKPYAARLTGYSLLKEIPEERNIITLNNNQIASFNTGLSLINSKFHFLLRTNLTPAKIEWYRAEDEKEIHDLGPELPNGVKRTVKKTIQPFPVCHPFLDYLNSNSSKEMQR